MTTEEYMLNTRAALTQPSHQKATLKPLELANHSDANIRLYSFPQMPMEEPILDYFLEQCTMNKPDLIFLQLEPMPYITRSRYIGQKCAMHDVEDYDVKAIPDINIPKPFSWEEAVVNLITLDCLRANNIHMKIDYTKGISSYSYPVL
jgi:hypothetical protein